ncbi:toprim domain-containing protein [Campylobacter geochelonis]|uniref:toprim domain-containing protein n=1 Tax=Campylobacter geochelonis TaxID=1780362 RepID=UPI000770855C|nr:toprim domain-containing protein [Campylobacter geochelonis]CZE50838.1 Uncharacterised protein [Campylobacter geochelonis]
MTYQDAKKLNLVDIIVKFGGILDESTKKYQSKRVKFRDTVLVVTTSQTDNNYIYFDAMNSDNKGSVIDFFQKNIDSTLTISQILSLLDSAVGVDVTVGVDVKIQHKNFSEIITKTPTDADLIRLSKWRGIDIKILNEFKSEIYIDMRGNFCFQHRKFNEIDGNLVREICGYEVRNTDFKGFQGEKGLWGKGVNNNSCQDIYLFESAIDAMSFCQLYTEFGFYVSLGGAFSEKQIDYIKLIIKRSEVSCLKICLDDDAQGDTMSVRLKSALESLKIEITREKPKNAKDFNDELKIIKSDKTSFNFLNKFIDENLKNKQENHKIKK